MWKVRVFTLYPEMFPGPLDIGLYKKAREKKLWSLEIVNIRDYATDKHKTVDDTPFGGGSSMLIRADVVANSLDKNISNKSEPIIYLTPKGKKFDHIYAKKILGKNVKMGNMWHTLWLTHHNSYLIIAMTVLVLLYKL